MKPKYKRVLLKLSGESLLPAGEANGICLDSAAKIVEEIKPVVEKGVELAIVVGGGNIFRGAAASKGGAIGQVEADTIGMLATAINALVLHEALQKSGLDSRVMTSRAMEGVAEVFNRSSALAHLAEKRVLVFAGGTGNPFFSTDTAASLRALQIDAEIILKGTKVDGVYSADPVSDPSAVRFDKLTYIDVLQKQLKVMDATAISMCMDHKLPVIVFNIFKSGNLLKAVAGEKMGTVVYG